MLRAAYLSCGTIAFAVLQMTLRPKRALPVITVPATTAPPLKAPFMNASVKTYFVKLSVLVLPELIRAFKSPMC